MSSKSIRWYNKLIVYSTLTSSLLWISSGNWRSRRMSSSGRSPLLSQSYLRATHLAVLWKRSPCTKRKRKRRWNGSRSSRSLVETNMTLGNKYGYITLSTANGRQNEVLDETLQMIPDCKLRLTKAKQDLIQVLQSFQDEESEEKQLAEAILVETENWLLLDRLIHSIAIFCPASFPSLMPCSKPLSKPGW